MPEGTEGRLASRLWFSMSGPTFPEALITKALEPLLTGTKVSQQQGSGQPACDLSLLPGVGLRPEYSLPAPQQEVMLFSSGACPTPPCRRKGSWAAKVLRKGTKRQGPQSMGSVTGSRYPGSLVGENALESLMQSPGSAHSVSASCVCHDNKGNTTNLKA